MRNLFFQISGGKKQMKPQHLADYCSNQQGTEGFFIENT